MTDHPPNVDRHDPRATAVQLARQIDELARALSYATMPPSPRLDHAADVYAVLGSLEAALSKLPQCCGQLVAFLHRQPDGLRAARGFPHAGQPATAVERTMLELEEAALAAHVSATALGRAQAAISGLSHEGPPAAAPPTRRPAGYAAADRARVVEL